MNDKKVSKDEISAFFEPDVIDTEFEDKKLGRVATLANQIVSLDKEINSKEAVVKDLKDQRRRLSEDMLPAVMTEHGLT